MLNVQHSPFHTHTHTSKHRWQRLLARFHLLIRSDNHTHKYTNGRATGSNLGIQYIAHGYFDMQGPGIKPPTFIWWATALPPETRPYYLFWFYFMFKHLKSGSTGWVAFWILWSTIITMNEDWKDLVCKGSGQPPHQSVGPRPSQQQHCHHR